MNSSTRLDEARRRGARGIVSKERRLRALPSVGAQGPLVAPDLSDIGAIRSAASLQRCSPIRAAR